MVLFEQELVDSYLNMTPLIPQPSSVLLNVVHTDEDHLDGTSSTDMGPLLPASRNDLIRREFKDCSAKISSATALEVLYNIAAKSISCPEAKLEFQYTGRWFNWYDVKQDPGLLYGDNESEIMLDYVINRFAGAIIIEEEDFDDESQMAEEYLAAANSI